MNTQMDRVARSIRDKFKDATGLLINTIIDYDDDFYVVSATRTGKVDESCDDPFFSIDKHTGDVTNFVPAYDLDKFTDAVEDNILYQFEY